MHVRGHFLHARVIRPVACRQWKILQWPSVCVSHDHDASLITATNYNSVIQQFGTINADRVRRPLIFHISLNDDDQNACRRTKENPVKL